MKYLIFLLAIFCLLIIETGVLGQLYFLPVVPLLLVIFCAILIPLEDKKITIWSIVISGIFLDFVSSLPDGILLLSLVFACLLSYILIYWWLVREFTVSILYISVAATTLVFFVSTLLLTKLFSVIGVGLGIDYGYLITRKLFWVLLLNTILTYPIYYYLQVCKLAARKLFEKVKI